MFLNLKLYLSRSLNKISTLPKDTVIFKNACERGRFSAPDFLRSRGVFWVKACSVGKLHKSLNPKHNKEFVKKMRRKKVKLQRAYGGCLGISSR